MAPGQIDPNIDLVADQFSLILAIVVYILGFGFAVGVDYIFKLDSNFTTAGPFDFNIPGGHIDPYGGNGVTVEFLVFFERIFPIGMSR